jgi:transcriptional regulator of acetoin/glycerol metabolism
MPASESDDTDTLDVGEKSAAASDALGLVLLYAPRPSAVAPALLLPPDRALVLGREPPDGGVVLPFGSVSRVHARIAKQGGSLRIEDLESHNGTFVNGRRVERAVLSPGDDIRVGEVVFHLASRHVAERAEWPIEGRVPPPPFERMRGGFLIERVRREIERIARADLSLLVLGESGTGKELVAQAWHLASRRSGAIATVNCAAVPANLLESELFGYKRGAFTGADRDRIGIVRSAHQGTLFLDEIGDMPLEAQAKLLRMLETRTVTPLGSHVAEPVDVRIVCATHQPIPELVRAGRFRGDLFARISGHIVTLPPLRERKEDIFQLAHHFLENAGGGALRVMPSFMIGLVHHSWPYNVRELEASMRRAVALAVDGTIDERLVPDPLVETARAPSPKDEAKDDGASESDGIPTQAELRALFTEHGGNVSAVARALGKDRTQIRRWMKRHGLTARDFSQE